MTANQTIRPPAQKTHQLPWRDNIISWLIPHYDTSPCCSTDIIDKGYRSHSEIVITSPASNNKKKIEGDRATMTKDHRNHPDDKGSRSNYLSRSKFISHFIRVFVILHLLPSSFIVPCYGSDDIKATAFSRGERNERIHGKTSSFESRSLIVGGEEAIAFRYPYLASLRRGSHQCSGTLIAPDVFLVAAHCIGFFGEIQLGRHNFSNFEEDYESFVIQESVFHPRYFRNTEKDLDAFDVALVHVYGQTKHRFRDIVTLDKGNGERFSAGQNLTVVGWGATDPDQTFLSSEILRQGVVQYVPNEECRNITGVWERDDGNFTVIMAAFVIDVVLCARDVLTDFSVDACQGDSGSPLLLVPPDSPNDIQVAIVSGGVECAKPPFPSLYPRVAEVYDWIRETTCRLSLDPPESFECPPVPTTAPVNDGDEMAMLLIQIQFDLVPRELGWILQYESRETVEIRPILTYRDEPMFSALNETIQVPNNQAYEFTILESYGGKFGGFTFFEQGSVTVTLLENNLADDTITETVLVQHDERFVNSVTYPLVLGTLPTMAPTQSPAPTSTMFPTVAPTDTRPFLSVVIDFDLDPTHTGYLVEAVGPDDETVVLLAAVYPGTFGPDAAETRVVQQVPLLSIPEGEGPQRYRFTMIDNENNGLQIPGRYQVYFGGNEDEEALLLFEGATFFIEDVHFFQVFVRGNGDVVAIADGQALPSMMPSPTPSNANMMMMMMRMRGRNMRNRNRNMRARRRNMMSQKTME